MHKFLTLTFSFTESFSNVSVHVLLFNSSDNSGFWPTQLTTSSFTCSSLHLFCKIDVFVKEAWIFVSLVISALYKISLSSFPSSVSFSFLVYVGIGWPAKVWFTKYGTTALYLNRSFDGDDNIEAKSFLFLWFLVCCSRSRSSCVFQMR